MPKRRQPTEQRLDGPDLIVTFTLVVTRGAGESAGCSMTLGAEGDELLVELVGRASETILRPAVNGLKTAIMRAIGATSDGPETDVRSISPRRSSQMGRA